MTDNKHTGPGVGYVSLIMIFAVICLTVLASLSYQAACANSGLNEKSVSYTTAYYEADVRAKETLSKLDYAAYEAQSSGFFEDSFEELISGYENITLRKTADGYEASYTEKISENSVLSVRITFKSRADERCTVTEWKTVTVTDEEENTPGVWNGQELA